MTDILPLKWWDYFYIQIFKKKEKHDNTFLIHDDTLIWVSWFLIRSWADSFRKCTMIELGIDGVIEWMKVSTAK